MIVSGTNLSMIRGDTEAITVNFSEALPEGAELTMTVRETVEAKIEIQKTHVCGSNESQIIFILEHTDTAHMNFGTYVYDIQLTVAGETVITLIPPSRLRLREEVTY